MSEKQMEKLEYLILMVVTLAVTNGQNTPDACSRLFTKLELEDPSSYDPDDPPPIIDGANSSVILIESQHRVVDVTEVCDVKRTVSLQLVSYKMWKDTRVKAKGKPSFIGDNLFRKCFWSPHFFFVNLHSSEDLSMSSSPNIYMVDGKSNIMVLSYSVVTVGCKFKYHMYPFDYQECDVLEVPMELESSQLETLGTSMHDTDNQRELQYYVVVGDSPVTIHKMGRLNYSAFGSRIYLKRRLNVHIMETYLPTSLFVVASWISFLIPPESVPGRMGMLVTLLLVQINIALGVYERAPLTPNMTALSLWCLLCIIQVLAATLQYGYLLHMSRLGAYSTIGRKAQALENKMLKKSFKFPVSTEGDEKEDVFGGSMPLMGAHQQKMLQYNLQHRQQRLDRISFFIFPVSFLFIGTVYWAVCIYLSKQIELA